MIHCNECGKYFHPLGFARHRAMHRDKRRLLQLRKLAMPLLNNEEPERALIIKKEWLEKIFDDGKVWEMRSNKTNVRGRICLIESGSGLIVGEATLTGCSKNPIPKDKDLIKYHKVEDLELLNKWPYAWYLENVERYKEPIPYEHPKGAVIWVKLK